MIEKIFVNNIGDLTEIQNASFYNFLVRGLSKELKILGNPLILDSRFSKKNSLQPLLYLRLNEIKVKGPKYSIDQCLEENFSYVLELYVPVECVRKETRNNELANGKFYQAHDLFLGELPLITSYGSFIINGCERVVVSQILRGPGIYFQKDFQKRNQIHYTATIITTTENWIKILFQQNVNKKKIFEQIVCQFSNITTKTGFSEPIKLSNIFKYFGITLEEVFDTLAYPEYFEHLLPFLNEANSLKKFKTFNNITTNETQRFYIGEITRQRINKRLGLNISKKVLNLTSLDFIRIIDQLIELKYHTHLMDDIDDLQNKRLRSVDKFLEKQLKTGLRRFSPRTYLAKKSSTFLYKNAVILGIANYGFEALAITCAFKEFFQASELSQFMDQTNPLSELTHKRRVTFFGPNGLKRRSITPKLRDIHASQYGRFCPIETGEGANAGIIHALAINSRISSLDAIEAPYFFTSHSTILIEKPIVYLSAEEENELQLIFCDFALNLNKKSLQKMPLAKEKALFFLKGFEKANLVITSSMQMLSIATALVPFLEHNDANRTLMGASMQRQALPLLFPQRPLVGTNLESAVATSVKGSVKSYTSGIVEHACSNYIEIQTFSGQTITYYLKKHANSNQNIYKNNKPIVWKGEKVFSGQLIASDVAITEGELSLGQNLTVAYIPWEGYNYEDAMVISSRLITDQCLTSVHISTYDVSLKNFLDGKEEFTNVLPSLSTYFCRNLLPTGIIKVGSYVNEGDVLIGRKQGIPQLKSPFAKLLAKINQFQVDAVLHPPLEKNLFMEATGEDALLKASANFNGRVIAIKLIAEKVLTTSTHPSKLRFYLAKIKRIEIGDKIAGRHGNKGIVSRILNEHDMPYLPDGTPVDLILNPLGIPSRMNVGQVFETLLGVAGEKLGRCYKVDSFDEIYGQEASRVLINQKLKEMSRKVMDLSQFQLNHIGQVFLQDGRTGEYYDNPILTGKGYFLKLMHLAEEKLQARSIGPYSLISQQPVIGKDVSGGQRFGEMEVWALEAYGCSHTLQELLNVKSDDIDARRDFYESFLFKKRPKPSSTIPESFLLLARELNGLGLDLSMIKLTQTTLSSVNFKKVIQNIFIAIENRLRIRTFFFHEALSKF